jgi:hypothetical protein
MLASQCDLLIVGMLRGFEDYAEVPPVDEDSAEGEAARDLLRWALVGVPPGRYETFAPARPLLATHDRNAINMLTLKLSTGSQGDELVSYGRALTAIGQVDQADHSPAGQCGVADAVSAQSGNGRKSEAHDASHRH